MVTPLYTTEDYREALTMIMGDPFRKRTAVVAYVGVDAADLLPNPKGCSVICWPQPGGTNPNGIRLLLKAGATVSFCDRMHAKVFWCEGVGLILGSANLSSNALGDGALVEAGVMLDESEFDIERLLSQLNPRKATQSDMDELDRAHRHFERHNPSPAKRTKRQMKERSFLEWYSLPLRPTWKMFAYLGFTSIAVSEDALATAERDFAATSILDWIPVVPEDIRSDDWVFCFGYFESSGRMRANPCWIYADFVSSGSGEEGYDEVCQVQIPSHDSMPFSIDKPFVNAFKNVFEQLDDWDKVYVSGVPCDSFIDAVAAEYAVT